MRFTGRTEKRGKERGRGGQKREHTDPWGQECWKGERKSERETERGKEKGGRERGRKKWEVGKAHLFKRNLENTQGVMLLVGEAEKVTCQDPKGRLYRCLNTNTNYKQF